jgi:hypothetical protein
MNAEESLNNFDYEGFMTREFPIPEGKYPDIGQSLGHLNKITRMLMECALQSIRVAERDPKASAVHANTRYTIVCNYRLRTINLIKIFTELLDVKGGSIFDEGTANIVARSLLESYLVYYRLYNGCKGDKEMQKLYFTLYDLSSRLHFVKFGNTLHMVAQEKFDEASLRAQIEKLISEVKSSKKYSKLPKGITNAIQKIEAGKQDYLSFVNFNQLIRESPLPTELVTAYYSYTSSFAHTEGFSSIVSQVYFQSRKDWAALNEMLKFRLIYPCLAVSAQFYISFIEYDKTQLADDNEKEVWEVLLLCKYYLTAFNLNQ